jgi:hypothetical protein
MNTSLTKSLNEQGRSFCTKKFATSEGQIENSYKCYQQGYTLFDSWSLLKQKRKFKKIILAQNGTDA